MKIKLLTSFVIVLPLVFCAYAQEGVNCHTTISFPCHTADFTPNKEPGCVSGAGTYTSSGNSTDHCVTAYGYLGISFCKSEPQVNCSYSVIIVFCNGTQSNPIPQNVPTTPTTTDGPCS